MKKVLIALLSVSFLSVFAVSAAPSFSRTVKPRSLHSTNKLERQKMNKNTVWYVFWKPKKIVGNSVKKIKNPSDFRIKRYDSQDYESKSFKSEKAADQFFNELSKKK
jgi:hypothetical protein